MRLLIDSGMRRAELAQLTVADVDLDQNVAVVLGKGRRPRARPFGRKTAIALATVAEATATSGASGTKPEGGITFAKITESIRTIALWFRQRLA